MAAGGPIPAAAPLLIDEEMTTMDDSRFDALTKSLSRLASRRDTVRVTVGSGIATALTALGLDDAGAKKGKNKKKKCKKPKVKCKKKCCQAGQLCQNGKCITPPPAEECQFSKTATLWTLQADCKITRTIEVPAGVSIDGNGKTIALSGPYTGFDLQGGVNIEAGPANISNLTIDGGGVTGDCPGSSRFPLLFWRGGQIVDVSLRDNACGPGIRTIDGPTSITGAAVSGMRAGDSGGAIEASPFVPVSITDSTIRDSDVGIFVIRGTAAIENNTLQDLDTGLRVIEVTEASITNNSMTNVRIGVDADASDLVTVTNNSITGPGSGSLPSTGILFSFSGSGSVSGNTISNFKDDDPGETSCGIRIDAGTVTIGENTFPDPPGNEQDVCDFS